MSSSQLQLVFKQLHLIPILLFEFQRSWVQIRLKALFTYLTNIFISKLFQHISNPTFSTPYKNKSF